MKGVVMAGGEGTRLRPLTSNQPKPMVPICGKPCIEHIIELLLAHDVSDVVVTLAFMPQAIRGYLGDGSSLGVNLEYSVEASPLGTAGSVRNAIEMLDDTFIVISGDALCDFDLTRIVEFHREKGSIATIALKSVDNPLEFGVVICDEEGRIERFLEKPSWGQVFSDTINTGVYVLEPEVLRHVPEGEPFDFSKQLFPFLLEAGRPLYGYTAPNEWYWQDIGNLDQYRQANMDVLDGRCAVSIPGIRLKENIWLGEGVVLPSVEAIEGPAYLGNYSRIAEGARVGPHAVLGSNVSMRSGAAVERSVVDSGTFVGEGAIVQGAIVGRACDLRAHVRVSEGVAVGDECSIGAEAVIGPGVLIYPYKTIEAGARIHQNLIWESRGVSTLFGRDGVVGIVNVDVTPEVATRLGLAMGTHLHQGDRIAASRDDHPASRLLKRAMLAGVAAAGVDAVDLRTAMPSLTRHEIRSSGLAGGFHVGVARDDPEAVEILFFEEPGRLASEATRRDLEKHYSRQDFRRAGPADIGQLSFPARALEGYVGDIVSSFDAKAVRERGFRAVFDYGLSAAALVVPSVMNELGVETIARSALDGAGRHGEASEAELLGRLVVAAGADLGVRFDRSGERIWIVDEQARPLSGARLLLLLASLAARRGLEGVVAVPLTCTEQVEAVVDGSGISVRRTRASAAAVAAAADEDGVIFSGADRGGFAFGRFLPAYDAVASLCGLLELLAPETEPLSALIDALPHPSLVHEEVACPWSAKGAVMRALIEDAKGRDTDSLDGLRVRENGGGWVQLLPDADRPFFHVFAEAPGDGASADLAARYRDRVAELVAAHEPEP